MKKFIKVKFIMLLTICLLAATSVFCASQNTLSAYAYTDEEIAAAKEWLAANGYPPTRAGAEQAYQDYLNGKFGPVQGSETPPADDASQDADKGNAAAGTPEAGAEQPNANTQTEIEQPAPDAATDAEQPASAETQPKTEENVNTATETKKQSSDTAADSKKQETDSTENTKKKEAGSNENTKKNEVSGAVTSKDNNTSSTGTQNKDTVTDKSQESIAADATDTTVNDASAIDLASASDISDTTTAAGAAAIGNVPAEAAGNSYTIVIIAVILVAAAAVCLIIYLRKRNERTAS